MIFDIGYNTSLDFKDLYARFYIMIQVETDFEAEAAIQFMTARLDHLGIKPQQRIWSARPNSRGTELWVDFWRTRAEMFEELPNSYDWKEVLHISTPPNRTQ